MHKRKNIAVILCLNSFLIISIIAICFFIYLQFDINNLKPIFYLLGDSEVHIEVGSEYEDPGYIALFNQQECKDDVKVTSNLDTTQVGDYVVNYNLHLKYLVVDKMMQRIVKVVDTTKPVLQIHGASEITIKKDTVFTPPTASAIDNYDGDISERIKILNTVNTHEVGTYSIFYTVEDSSNNKQEYVVTVHVIDKNPYIDISIPEQKLTYYEFNEIVLQTDIVTGIYDRTPIGNYSVLYKSKNTVLRGTNYTSYVSYWIAFLGRAYGIHDASWRNEFGGEIYKNNGSHGCINVPYENAKKLYELVEVGTPVYIHK